MELHTRQHKLQPGLLLISKPELGDPRFLTSVTLLCHHDEDGSFGVILNHPMPLLIDPFDFSIYDEIEDGKEPFPISRGGPVGLEQCVALNQHPLAKDAPGAAEVLPNLYLGSTTETLQHWKDHDALHPESCRFFLGYAGWSFFQLDCETSNDWWFTLPAQSNTPFLNEPEGLWLASLKKLGAEFYDAGLAFINADLE